LQRALGLGLAPSTTFAFVTVFAYAKTRANLPGGRAANVGYTCTLCAIFHELEEYIIMSREIIIYILNICSFVFVLLFLFSFILVQILKKDLSLTDNFISHYAIGKYSSIITLGFFFYSLSLISLSLCYLISNIYFCFILILLSGLGMLIVSIFPTDYINSKPTLIGKLHFIGAIIYYGFILLGIIFSLMSLKSILLKYYTIINICLMSILLTLLGLFTYNSKLIRFKIKGLIQKLYIIFAIIWIIVTNLILLNFKFMFK
jgi:hypothetical protein